MQTSGIEEGLSMRWEDILFALDSEALKRFCSVSGDEEYRTIQPESFELFRHLASLKR